MDDDVKVTDLRDYIRFEQGGEMFQMKRAVFYIGKFGPFTEEWPRDEYSLAAFEARVAMLKANLPVRSR